MRLLHLPLLLLLLVVVTLARAEIVDRVNLTLVHLQVLFRHGDRAPLIPLIKNDPYEHEKYWPNGFDELTNTGRARMYHLGEFIRDKYQGYLGDKFSPREVYARSAAIDRCLESAQLVLAGSYPPNSSQWQWASNDWPTPLAQLWQPIPIVSYVPADDDSILRMKKPCPKFDDLKKNFFESDPSMIKLLNDHRKTIDELTALTGTNMSIITQLDKLRENLLIEHEHGYYWSDHFQGKLTREREMEITRELHVFSLARWNNEFQFNQWAKRNRAGGILTLIGENFRNRFSVRDLEYPQKIVVLSSHDTKLVAVMEALDVWNHVLMPYASTLFFELHQHDITQYYVRVLYLNTTDALLDDNKTVTMYPLELPGCFNQTTNLGPSYCPLEQFLKILEPLKITQAEIDGDCGIDNSLDDVSYMTTINILLLVSNLAIFFILLLLLMYFCTKLSKKPGYTPLE